MERCRMHIVSKFYAHEVIVFLDEQIRSRNYLIGRIKLWPYTDDIKAVQFMKQNNYNAFIC